MTYVPFIPEIGAAYTLLGPDGTTVTFNDSTDPNYGGILSDVTGLDSADVRESGDVLVATDGGWHGNFYYGRRPITITGVLPNIVDAADRATKLDRVRNATNAMRADAILSWQNTAVGSVPMQTWVRRQQPARFTGAWVKTFNILLVSQFAQLFSVALHTSATAASVVVENHGNSPAFPIISIHGAITAGVTVTNSTTGLVVQMLSTYSQSAGDVLAIDVLNHTATKNGSTTVNSYIDFVNSTWPTVNKGLNTFSVSGGPILSLAWRDTWS